MASQVRTETRELGGRLGTFGYADDKPPPTLRPIGCATFAGRDVSLGRPEWTEVER